MRNTKSKYQSTNLASKYTIPFLKHLLTTLLTLFAFSLTTNIASAGGRTTEPNLMDDFLQQQTNSQSVQAASILSTASQSSINNIGNDALVFNRSATGVDNAAFNTAFSLNKTLGHIRNSSNETSTSNSNTQLLGSLLNTFNTTTKANGFVNMPLQTRNNEANLSPENLINGGMLPTAIFNRFDLAASDGKHCGEYRIIYATGGFFLIFEAQYPNPEPAEGSAGCFSVADFWRQIGQKTKAEALIELEKFFYQGLVHNSVNLPAAINFNHYTQGTGQVRSNSIVDGPWQLREFKTTIDANGKAVLVADTVKSNPLAELFSNEQDSDSDALKALRTYFNHDFDGIVDNLLAPEKQTTNPSNMAIINGFSLSSNNIYNEFQSDASSSDNTANQNNTTLDAAINNKLTALDLPDTYTPNMIRNRAEAMSCGGCHQNSNGAEIAPNIHWPNSGFFVHVNGSGNLSDALTSHFLPARAALLEHYLQEIEAQKCGPACQLGSASSYSGTFSCAIKLDNTVACWGNNNYGQTDTPSGLIARQIALGRDYACALKLDNTVECWGNNSHGKRTTPADLGKVKQIALGSEHSCAIKFDDTVKCWGRNFENQINVPIGLAAQQVTLGWGHSCALKLDNSVECWGYNGYGQTDVPTILAAKQVISGHSYLCALKLDNSVECWGQNFNEQTNVPVGLNAKQVALGYDHSCALKLDDTVECWGGNNDGQTDVPNGLTAKQIVAGYQHVCALKSNGDVECWGRKKYGRVDVPENLVAKQL